MNYLTPQTITGFRDLIWRFHYQAARSHLPWRQNFDPYQIMVSEIMLQQTQVDRVIPKFVAFIQAFPTLTALASAPTSQVIRLWQGLGYNRRGLNLQKAAIQILSEFQGRIPQTREELLTLPGIGPYTAAAILTFAFNQPVMVIETNIRTVFLYHFFPDHYQVEDGMLTPLIEATLDQHRPREWYSALMDYGSYLKQIMPNPNRRSQHYVKQSPLVGSNREVRGKILKVLAQQPLDHQQLFWEVGVTKERFETALQQLMTEQFIQNTKGIITLID